MKRKLKCIMLIDDNILNNSFHELIIKKTGITEKVIAKESAKEALENMVEAKADFPDLIFLDINMPGMTGWDFLDEFEKIENVPHKPVVVMLSTSDDPNDIKRAGEHPVVSEFRTKPLTKKMLEEIQGSYFLK